MKCSDYRMRFLFRRRKELLPSKSFFQRVAKKGVSFHSFRFHSSSNLKQAFGREGRQHANDLWQGRKGEMARERELWRLSDPPPPPPPFLRWLMVVTSREQESCPRLLFRDNKKESGGGVGSRRDSDSTGKGFVRSFEFGQKEERRKRVCSLVGWTWTPNQWDIWRRMESSTCPLEKERRKSRRFLSSFSA